MKACAKYGLVQLLALLLCAPVAFAQTESPPPEVPAFSQQELDQMLAPIALYPDSLLSQILMASTYPLEVVAAARWSRANPGLSGEQAVKAVDERNWDPSVKSLVAFPQVLTMMDEKLDWMERLGDAFLAQQSQVMDTVQDLRRKADAAGNLKSGDHYRVEHQGETIVVESPYREVIYVPYYDPLVVYGPWWWPAYPPVHWRPWPGYYAYPGFVGFRWSVGIVIGPRFFFGACDWRQRHIRVVDVHPFYYHRVDRRPMHPHQVWRHNPDHRRGVVYRHPSVRDKFVRTVRSPEVRRDVRAHVPSSHQPRVEHGKHQNTRPGHENQRPEQRRGPSHNGGRDDSHKNPGAAPSRVNSPVVRSEPNRRDNAPAAASRPGPEARPARGDDDRGREERGAKSRGNVGAQGRMRDGEGSHMSQSSGRYFARESGGGSRDGDRHSSSGNRGR